MTSSFRAALLTMAGILFLGYTSAQAQTLLIEFGAATVTDTNSYTWNVLGTATNAGLNGITLKDITGSTAAGITLTTPAGTAATGTANSGTTFGTGSGNGYTGSGTTPIVFPLETVPVSALTNDWYMGGGQISTLTFGGLDTTGTVLYTFSFTSARGSSNTLVNRTGTFTFTGASTTALTIDAGANGGVTANGTAANGNATVYSVSLFADATGHIVITDDATAAFKGTGAGFGGYLNAMEVSGAVVPEPSTVALAIIGGLGLFTLVIRRRKLAHI